MVAISTRSGLATFTSSSSTRPNRPHARRGHLFLTGCPYRHHGLSRPVESPTSPRYSRPPQSCRRTLSPSSSRTQYACSPDRPLPTARRTHTYLSNCMWRHQGPDRLSPDAHTAWHSHAFGGSEGDDLTTVRSASEACKVMERACLSGGQAGDAELRRAGQGHSRTMLATHANRCAGFRAQSSLGGRRPDVGVAVKHVLWIVNGFDPSQTVILYGSVAGLDAILLVLGHLVDIPADTDRVRVEGTP